MSLANAISMGLRSGLYGGKKRNHAPTARMASAALLAFVGRQVVEDDHIAGLQGRGQLGLDIKLEQLSIHRTLDHPWRIQTVVAQGGDKGLGVPVAEGRMVDKARAFFRPAGGLRHVRFQGRFVDETDARQQVAHERLAPCDPDMARLSDLRPLLLDGLEVFFLCVRPRLRRVRQTETRWTVI